MPTGPIIRAFFTALLLVFQLGCAHAYDDTGLIAAEREATGMRSDLERVQTVLDQVGVTDDQLAEQRDLVLQLRLNALAETDKLNSPLEDVKQQLNQLGPAPAAGQPEETSLASQRKTLTDAVSRFTAAKKQFELLGVETEQMSGKVSAQQRSQFFQRIFKADKSIFSAQLWRDAYVGAGLFSSRLSSLISIWWQNQTPNAAWSGLLLFPAVLLAIAAVFRIFKFNITAWITARSEVDGMLSPLRRLWRVVWGVLVIVVALLFLAALLVATLGVANLLTPRFELLLGAIMGVISQITFNTGFALLICAPRKPMARLIAVDDRAARIIPLFVFMASLVQSLAAQATILSDQLLLPVSLVAGQSAFAAVALIALAGLLLVLLRKQANSPPATVPEPHYLTWFVALMPLLWILLAIAIFGLVFGYLALAYFIASKIVDTVLVVVLMVLVHHLIDAFADTLQNPASGLGMRLRNLTHWADRGIARLALSFRTLADILLVVLGIPWLLALWSVTWFDFRSLFNSAIVGFRLGNITVSPIEIASVIALLAFGVVLTRLITGWLNHRVLTQTRLNQGVQNSVRTGANYFGYTLAAAIALSAAGFDFSKIAIIAGALGVGIGFGLQSTVNNFVSGLILLAERPVRVGDWVVLNAGEGIVKKINVRSTEIETFDNCTIIVPNSMLIIEAVRNWTHRDTLGRFLVSVGVAHGTDADLVNKTLSEIITSHPKVLRYPPPTVMLSRFGPQATEFELRGHVADVFEIPVVSNEIRMSISRKFAAHNIIIPTV